MCYSMGPPDNTGFDQKTNEEGTYRATVRPLGMGCRLSETIDS
jgi:hypothetical protein